MKKSKRILSLLFLCVMFMTCMFQPMQADASAGKVTAYEKITWGISTGRYYVNGIHAFCAEYSKSWPTVETPIASITLCENEVLRKALYYGYNGPKNTLGTDAKAHVLTAIAVSDANIGERETGASAKYDTFYWELINNPSEYATPPSNFKAYLAKPSSTKMQTLAFYQVEKNGYVKAVKNSADADLTAGNSCYSLAGAEYGLYSDASVGEGSRVGTLVTDENGATNVVELPKGTYYAKELKSPKGYAKSTEVIPFTVASDKTTTLQVADDPQVNPIVLLLQKVDAQTELPKAQGIGSLQGAQFTVKYYAGVWEADVDPQSLGKTPSRSWIFETDENGQVHMKASYLVSGDALYAAVPLGTITIQETKPSEGYLLNPTVFVRQITAKGEGQNVDTYQYPTVKEEKIPPYEVVIHKKDDYGNLLEGAEFVLFADEACEQEITRGVTDSDGILRFSNLEVGMKYYLKETKAPAGYNISKEHEKNPYTIHLLSSPEDNEYHLDVRNEVEIVLPKTGTFATVLVPAMGVILCSISMYLTSKKRRNEL